MKTATFGDKADRHANHTPAGRLLCRRRNCIELSTLSTPTYPWNITTLNKFCNECYFYYFVYCQQGSSWDKFKWHHRMARVRK